MKRKRAGAAIIGILGAAVWASVAAAAPQIANGDFEGGFHFVPPNDDCPISWTMLETHPEEFTVITSRADNGPSALGASSVVWRRSVFSDETTFVPSSDWTAIEQVLAYDVTSAAEELILTMDVKVVYHDHGGGGWSWDQWEYPVTVRVDYVDLFGTERYWQFGWYEWYDDVSGPPPVRAEVFYGNGVVCSMQVPSGVWIRNTFRLSHELRDPRTITGIRIGGSGWAFEGAVDNVTMQGPIPVPSTSWGAIKNLYRNAE